MAKFFACYHVPSGGNGEPGTAHGRSGVALVIVLGLLALLMITGVSFTILMRIERSGSSNLRHTSAARQMAKGGIAYAIAAINDDIGTNRYPNWPDRPFKNAEGRTQQERDNQTTGNLRIPEDIFLSVVESEDEPLKTASARVMSAEAAHYLPAALRHRAEMIRKNDIDYAAPEWIPVVARNSTIGRYAYVVLNTTGLLDANRVQGSLTNRWMGASPAEIRLDPDVTFDVINAKQFGDQRKTHGRYETLPELSRKNKGLDGATLANFDVFSYNLPDLIPVTPPPQASAAMLQAHKDLVNQQGANWLKGIPGKKIDIGTEKKIEDQQAKITLAFKAAGLNDVQANWAYLGLLDYVDDGNSPKGTTESDRFARPATEAMPLFSLVMVNMKYDKKDLPADGDGKVFTEHRMTYTYAAVFTYPFQTRTGPFNLEAKIMCAIIPGDAGKWGSLVPPADPVTGFPAEIKLTRNSVTCAPGSDAVVVVMGDPITYGPVTQLKSDPDFSAGDIYMAAGGRTYSDKGTILRQVPVEGYNAGVNNSQMQLVVHLTPQDITRAKTGAATYWIEAIDPRYNHRDGVEGWRASRNDDWMSGDDSAPLNKLNNILPTYTCPDEPFTGIYNSLTEHMLTTPSTLKDYFKIYTDGIRIGDDDVTHCDPIIAQVRAHVADRPLQSVGELGYLPIGVWLTINLFDHEHNPKDLSNNNYPNNKLPAIGYHPVLDYFVIGDPNKGVRGKVNLNTVNPEVMGAVFNQMPLQIESHTPEAPGPIIAAKKPGTLDDALELADWIIYGKKLPKDRVPYERISDLGRIFHDTPQLGLKAGSYAAKDPIQLLQKATAAYPGGFGEFEREALIRNACGLLTLRGQTFTVILRADAFAPRFGMTGVKQGNVLATATAVAQIWRDTEPMITEARNPVNNKLEKTYNYPTFIQFFKILNE